MLIQTNFLKMKIYLLALLLIAGCSIKQKVETKESANTKEVEVQSDSTLVPADTLDQEDDWMPERISADKLDYHGPVTWETVEEGIDFVEIDSAIWVFKIDPKFYRFSIAKHDSLDSYYVPPTGHKQLPEWGRGTNLNMFTYSNIPNGYTKVDGAVLQPEFNKYNMFLVWNDDEFKMLDRREEDISEIDNYPNVSQNERMISAKGVDRNRWSVNERYWSVATIGVTHDGKVLLIHSRQPYTMHNFIDIMLAHEDLLNIKQMAYLEGGPESSIYINEQYQRMGSFETSFNEFYDNDYFWELPFALVFEKK